MLLVTIWLVSTGFAQTSGSYGGGSYGGGAYGGGAYGGGSYGGGTFSGQPGSMDTADCASDPMAPNCGGGGGGVEGARMPSMDIRTGSGFSRYDDRDYSSGYFPNSYYGSPFQPYPYATQQTFPPEPLSEFQRFVIEATGARLPIYGAGLFRNVPSTFAPSQNMPVSPDYVLGPGDELRIRSWGQLNAEVQTSVDRAGQIYFPKVGAITLSGVKYGDLVPMLKREVGKVYKNFDLTASMGRLRSIQVFVVGYARRPGSYNVGSMSTLLNALFASGGISSKGSLRKIQVKRNDQVVTEFDLYDLLLRGDKSKDIQLQAGDVIFVPPAGPVVAMAGSLQNPGIYELKGRTTLGDALGFVGGLSATADGQKAIVERIDDHRVRNVQEFPLDQAGVARELKDGDVVQVISIVPMFANAVTIRGNVANPGRYPWREGMKLLDLIPNREFLLTREYWRNQNTLGRLPASPEMSIGDQPGQSAQTFTGGESQQPTAGTGTVQAGAPTTTAVPARSTTSSGVESLAGASVASAQQQTSQAELSRADTTTTPAGNQTARASMAPRRGTEELAIDIKRSAPDINWDYAVIQRLNPVDLTTQLLPFNLGRLTLQNDESQNLALRPGDVVTIFSQRDLQVPMERRTKFVRLEGEVRSPGVYRVEAGETLRTVVQKAGGLTSAAYLYGSEFTRESLRKEQQRGLDATVRNVELNLASQGIPEGLLVDKLRQLRASGRMVLEMRPSDAAADAIPTLALEDGDRLAVPRKPDTIDVVGAVYNQSSFLYRANKSVKDYVLMAGQGTREADRKHMFLIRADGSVIARNSGTWSGSFQSLRVLPGDVIVIPLKVSIKGARLAAVGQWSQLFSQFALGAASLAVIGR